MENNTHINDLVEEGKKHLVELQTQLEKLTETAKNVASSTAVEGSKKAEDLMKEATAHVDAAKETIAAKTKEVMESEKFKEMEMEGKKVLDDVHTKINDLSKEISDKLTSIFGK
jgi:ElaB/YqjD/DUF883 family membrane-anchored ribosome-binding protein